MKIVLPLAALAAGFLVAPSAHAQAVDRIVRTADLRLDTPAGVARLDRRIAVAARDVCATDASSFPSGRADARRCRIETIAAFAARRDAVIAAMRSEAGTAMVAAR